MQVSSGAKDGPSIALPNLNQCTLTRQTEQAQVTRLPPVEEVLLGSLWHHCNDTGLRLNGVKIHQMKPSSGNGSFYWSTALISWLWKVAVCTAQPLLYSCTMDSSTQGRASSAPPSGVSCFCFKHTICHRDQMAVNPGALPQTGSLRHKMTVVTVGIECMTLLSK